VSFLPRAVIGAAPALFLLVAGALLIQKYRPDQKPSAGEPVTAIRPTVDDEETQHLTALKQETILDLLDGRLTLVEAVERFHECSATSSRSLDFLRDRFAGASEEEKVINQVMAFARNYALRNPGRYSHTFARLEAEAYALAGVVPTAQQWPFAPTFVSQYSFGRGQVLPASAAVRVQSR
jgi:hypothetical protein